MCPPTPLPADYPQSPSPSRCSRDGKGQAEISAERVAVDFQNHSLGMMEVVATRTDLVDVLSII